MNFNGINTIIAEVTFPVSKETISSATEIPMQGEKWFKGMPLELMFYIDSSSLSIESRKLVPLSPGSMFWNPTRSC